MPHILSMSICIFINKFPYQSEFSSIVIDMIFNPRGKGFILEARVRRERFFFFFELKKK